MPHSLRKSRPASPRLSLHFVKRLSSWLLLSTGLTVAALQIPVASAATTYYWDTTTTGLWSNGANWSDINGLNPGTVPASTDFAFFDANGVSGPEIIQLSAATTIAGLTFANTGTTLMDSSSTTTQTLTIGSSGIAVNSGAGAVTIGDPVNQTNLTLGAAQSWLNNSGSLLSILGALNNGGFLLTIGGSGATSVGGILSGAGGLTLSGTASVTLSGINTYAGATTLASGAQLNYNSAKAIGAGTLTISGGTLDNTSGAAIVAGNNNVQQWNGDFTFLGGSGTTHDLSLGTGAVTLSAARQVTVNAGTLTVGGGISGATFTLTKAGAGTLSLGGVIATTTGGLSVTNGTLALTGQANTFTGNVTVDGASSVLSIVGNSAGTYTTTGSPLGNGVSGAANFKTVTLTNGATFRVASQNYNDNVLSTTNIGAGVVFMIGSGGGVFDVASGSTLTVDDGTLGVTGTTTGSPVGTNPAQELQGTGALLKTGTGILVLRQQYNFGGTITIAAGTLQASGPTGALGVNTAGTTIQSGATFNVNGQAITDTDQVTISGSGLTATPAGAITNNSGTAGSYGGAIVLSGDAAVGTSAAGGLTLSGGITGIGNLTINNTSTGGTSLTTGTVNNTGTITNSGAGTGTTTIATVGTNVTGIIQSGTSPLTISGAYPFATLGYTFTNTGAGLYTISGGVTGTGSLVLNANSTGGITLSTTAVNNTGTITNSGTGTGTATISIGIGASVTNILQNSATSTLALTVANTYTGTTTVAQGTLSFGNVGAFGSSATPIVLGGASTAGNLTYTGAAATLTRSFTLNAGGSEFDSTAAVLTINPGGVLTAAALTLAPAGPLTFGGANGITLGGGTATVPLISGTNLLTKIGAGNFTLSTLGGTAPIQSAMPISIQAGTLTVQTTAVNTTNPLGTAGITITPGATLSFTNAGAIFALPNNLTIANAAGTVNLTTSGTLTSTGTVTFAAGASTPTLKLNNTSSSPFVLNLQGVVSGVGNIQFNPSNAGSTITVSGAQNQTGTISNVGSSTQLATLSGIIGSGITGISQAGANPFTVSSAVPLSATLNTFTSTGAGTFTFSNASAFTGSQPLTFNANSSGAITVSGATAVNNSGTVTNSGTGNNLVTISGSIGANVTNIFQSGATSQLILSGTNAYTGAATVSAGILDFTTTLAMPGYATSPATAFGRITGVAAGATLAVPFGGATNSVSATEIANLINGTYSILAAGSSLGIDTTNAASSNTALGTLITDLAGGSLGFTKTGTQSLTVNSANTYTGPTAIANGTLVVGKINSVSGGSGSSDLGAPTTVANGTISLGLASNTGVLSYTGAGETTDRVLNFAGAGGGGTIDQSGSGNLTFTSNVNFTGVGAKSVTLSGSTSSVGTISGNFVGGINGAAGGAITINKTGTGTWVLSGTGNTAQNLAISGGTMDFGPNGIFLSDIGGSFIQASGNAVVKGRIQLGGVAAGTNNGPDIGAAAGFTLDLTGVTLADDATVTQAYVDFYGGSSSGTTLLSNTNTYSVVTDLSSGTYVVGSINSVTTNAGTGAVHSAASGLGSPSSIPNGTLNFTTGSNATLKYIGTGEVTDRAMVFTNTAAGFTTTLDQSGTGLLKFLGNVTASGGATHILNLQGSTAGTGEMAGAIGQNTTAFTTAVTKNGTGTWTLSGVNTYTGATTISGGNLILSTSGVLSNTGIVINNGGMFSPVAGRIAGNIATGAAGATLTLNPGGFLNLADGTVGNFTLVQNSTFAGNAATFTGGTAIFDINASAADTLVLSLNNVAGTGLATSSGLTAIVLNPVGGALSSGANYTLIQAGGSLSLSNFYLATPNVYAGGQLFTLSLSLSSTNLTVSVNSNSGAPITPASAFWNGTLGTSWATQNGTFNTNFVAAATGAQDTLGLPGIGTNVTFTSNSATNTSTTLDQSFEINSLTFTGTGTSNTAGSSIASGSGTNTLRIDATNANGATAGNGLTVLAGSGANSISANVALGGSQTWTTNATTTTTVSGVISEITTGTTLTKAGTGVLALNGLNTFTGAFSLTAGTVSVASFGTTGNPGGLGEAGTVTIGSGTNVISLIYTGTGETTDHVLNLAGTTGGVTLDQSGTGNLKFTSAIAATGVGSKTLTLQGSTAGTGEIAGAIVDNLTGTNNTAVTKTGTGAWTLSGANTYTGNTTVTGGTLNITGSIAGNATTSTLAYGGTANNTVVNVNGTISEFSVTGATVAGAVAVYNQTGGTVSVVGNNGVGVSAATAGYGYINVTGGALTTPIRITSTAGAGTGVIYIGGTGSISAQEYILIAYGAAGATGSLTVGPGGTVNHNGASKEIEITWSSGNNEYGVLSVAGGTVNTDTHAIQFGSTTQTGVTGILNLAAGTVNTGIGISNLSTSGANNYINLAGGTIVAGAAMTNVLPLNATTLTTTMFGPIANSASAAINSGVGTTQDFAGGFRFDSGTFASTINTTLKGASGNGITQANITIPGTGNSGYIGAPMVQFSAPAGGGVPASGYALISGGQVIGIVITAPGTYAANETPTITLTGGGGSIAPFATSALTTANGSGGLTKLGSGSLTLTGTNTYTGVTKISGGILALANLTGGGIAGGIGAASNAAANLVLDGGTLKFTGTAATTVDRNFTLTTNGGGFDASGTTLGTLNYTGTMTVTGTTGAQAFTLTGTGTGATGAATYGGTIVNGGGTNVTSFIKSGTGTWTLGSVANTYTGATALNGGILVVSKLDIGGNSSSIGQSTNAAANLVLNGATLQYTGAGATTDRNFTFGNATTASGAGLDSEGTGALVISGGMTAINTAAGTQVLALTANAGSGANALNGAVVDSSGTALTGVTKAGVGAWTLGGANAYTGVTTVNAGTLNITGTNTNASPITFGTTANGVININSSGTVSAGAINWGGATGGVINLVTGTLLANGGLTSTSATVNALNFNGGTLKSGAALAISSTLNIAVQAGGGTIDTTGGNITSASNIGNTASPGDLTVQGGNKLTTAFGATYTGNTTLAGTGTNLTLTAAATFNGAMTLGAGTTLDLNNLSHSFGGLGGSGTIVNTGASALRTLTITGAGGKTFSGNIAPAATPANTALTVNLTSGAQTLQGTNTYTGATTISGGTLALGAGSLGNTAITVSAAASGAARTFAATPGTGTATAGNSGTIGAGATLTIAAGSTANPVAGAFTMVDNALGTFNLMQESTFAGAALTIGGSAGTGYVKPTLTFDIGGASLTNIDVFNVSTLVSVGTGGATLNFSALSSASSLAAGNYVFMTAAGGLGSNFTLFDNTISVGASTYLLSLANSTATSEVLTVTALGTNAACYWTGSIDGSWATLSGSNSNFATSAAGTFNTNALPDSNSNVLFTANSASHPSTTLDQNFTINSLEFTGTGTSNTAGVTIASGLTGPFTLTINAAAVNGNNLGAGIVVDAGAGADLISANIALGANQTWTNNSSSLLTVSGVIGDGGLGYSLNEAGTGTLLLSNLANTFSGGVTVSAGILDFAGTGSLGTGALTMNGGTLQWLTGVTDDVSKQADTTPRTVTFTSTAILDTNANNVTLANPVGNGGAGGLTKIGLGTLTLGGTNTYTGITTITAGVLSVSSAANLGTNATAAAITFPTGGTGVLRLTGTGFTASTAGVTLTGPGIIDVQGTDSGTIASIIAGAGTLTKTGNGTLALTNTSNSFTGAIAVTGGVLAFPGNGGTTGDPAALGSGGKTITLTNGGTVRPTSTSNPTGTNSKNFVIGAGGGGFNVPTGVTFQLDDASQFSGTGDLAITGAGFVFLNTQTYAFSGSVTIGTGATLRVGSSGAVLGTTTAGRTITIASGGVFDVQQTTGIGIATSVSGSGVGGTGALLNTSIAAGILSGAITLTGDTTVGTGSTGTLNLSGLISGGFGLTRAGGGAGAVILSNTGNTYTGQTLINLGILRAANIANVGAASSALGAPTTAAAGTIKIGSTTNAATLQIFGTAPNTTDRVIDLAGTTGGATLDDSTANGTGAVTFTSDFTASGVGAKTLTLTGTNTDSNTIGGAIVDSSSGATSVLKTGVGTWFLAGANSTYTGNTNIDQGILGISTIDQSLKALVFGSTTAITTVGTLQLTTANATFNSLVAQTNTASASTINIASGKTLNITGSVTIGSGAGSNTTTALTAAGLGTFAVTNTAAAGTFTVGGTSGTASVGNVATADFSALASMNVNLSGATSVLRVNPVISVAPDNISGRKAVFKLAQTSTLTAAAITIGGGTTFNSDATQINQLVLGSTSNALNAGAVNVGTGGRDIGTITFGGSTGTVTIRAQDGSSRAAFNIGTGGASTATAGANNLVDFTGHNADLLLSTLAVGNQARTGNLTSTFSFDTGTLDATAVTVGFRTGTATTTAVLTDVINIGGGTVTIGTGGLDVGNSSYNQAGVAPVNGTVNVTGGTVTIANNSTFGAAVRLVTNSGGSANAGNVSGTLAVSGGTVTLAGSIIRGAVTGTQANVATVTLSNSGTLDMGSKNIGASGNLVTFNAQGGTLANLNQLNGGATLSKTTAGTLTLAGINHYTGLTDVTAGKVIVSGSISGSVQATAGTTLASGNNTTAAIGGDVNLLSTGSGGGTLAPGDTGAAGKLTVSGNVTLGGSGQAAHLAIEIGGTTGGTLYDQVQVATGSTLSLANANLDLALINGFNPTTLTLATYNDAQQKLNQDGSLLFIVKGSSLAVQGTFQNAGSQDPNLTGFGTYNVGGQLFAVSYTANFVGEGDPGNSFTGGHDVALMAIPEPNALAMMAGSLGLALGLQRFRRRRSA